MPDIYPTVFIGLGGTGKEVLLRLRRKFREEFGRPSLPCTRFLWLDTDRSQVLRDDNESRKCEGVEFDDSERVTLLSGNVGELDVFTNPAHYSHIHLGQHGWLYPEVERYGTGVADGAGNIRAIGRLCFFQHYDSREGVVQKLTKALDIQTAALLEESEELFRNRGPEQPRYALDSIRVCVVGSIAGGTGAGTLLDMAFLLKLLRPQFPAVSEIFGFVVLPQAFFQVWNDDDKAKRCVGNGYAALKELEHFTRRIRRGTIEIDFDVEWAQGRAHQIPGPPFSATYLFETTSTGNVRLDDPNELLTMLAEHLYQDFQPGAFPERRRSIYSDTVAHLAGLQDANIAIGDVNMDQVFSRRYASFGMAKWVLSIEAIKGACVAQLACDILGHLGRRPMVPNLQGMFQNDLRNLKFTSDGMKERFGKDWQEQIRGDVQALFAGKKPATGRDVQELEARIVEFEGAKISQGQFPGALVSAMEGTGAKVRERVERELGAWLEGKLRQEDGGPHECTKDGGYLDLMIRRFDEGQLQAECSAAGSRSRSDAEHYKRERDAALADLNMAVTGLLSAGLAVRSWTVDKMVARLREAEEQFLLARVEEPLWEAARRAVVENLELLKAWKRKLVAMQDRLPTWRQWFQDKKARRLQLRRGVIIREFFEPAEFPVYYVLDGSEVRPSREAGKFADGVSLLALADVQNPGETGLEDFSRRRVEEGFSHPAPGSSKVLASAVAHYRNMRTAVDKLIEAALPRLRRESHLAGIQVPVQRSVYLGVDDNTPLGMEFRTEMAAALAAKGYTLGNAILQTNPTEIYLHLSEYAFPLAALPAITGDSHNAYHDFYRALVGGVSAARENQTDEQAYLLHIPLHLDARWENQLPDLKAYTQQEATALRDSHKALLFGSLLGVLQRDKAGQYSLFRKKGAGCEPKNLGPEYHALQELASNVNLRKTILGEIASREAALSPQEATMYFWILTHRQYSADGVSGGAAERLLVERIDALGNSLVERDILKSALVFPARMELTAIQAEIARELVGCGCNVDMPTLPLAAFVLVP